MTPFPTIEHQLVRKAKRGRKKKLSVEVKQWGETERN